LEEIGVEWVLNPNPKKEKTFTCIDDSNRGA
jgi:hypothetical protein